MYRNERSSRHGLDSIEPGICAHSVFAVRSRPPSVLDHGIIDGHRWMASTRLPGDNLHQLWPELAPASRKRAISDLWSRLQALHTTDVEAARTAGCTRTRFYDLDPTRWRNQLGELVTSGALRSSLAARLAGLLAEAFEAIPLAPIALTHTDASPGNTVLTPTGQAIPVDLEAACLAPVDLELENLFRTLYYLGDRDTFLHLTDLTADLLHRPGAAARLRGYAVLRDLWALRRWLRNAHDNADPARSAPVKRLGSHADSNSWVYDIFACSS